MNTMEIRYRTLFFVTDFDIELSEPLTLILSFVID